ncbi:hypothetical protein DFH07DRAFT_426233 [Mycena maculata]|uniref:F-box domain-containing protein n=1 Tax=Mycena maculata TaxID=230809 RepID=A0AAD7JEL9_9AGAR|nr:hypothetical protein DFH07DRAFT_426233 [Mycena maculata]
MSPPTPSLGRKSSAFRAFWKKPRSRSPIPHEISDILLPVELWLDVLAGVPEHALEPVSRVCKRLRWIVLPLYFRSQQVFPFQETFAFRRLNMGVELAGYQDRSLKRLDFLSSDQLSAAVRELFVSPYPPGYNRRHRIEHRPVEDVMERLLVVLPKFTNLTKLVLHLPLCNATLFASLKSLRLYRLDYLELEMHPTSRGDVPIPARKEFLFNRSTSPIQLFPPVGLSLIFLFPESIEHMVAGPTGTDTLTRALARHPTGFPSLHSLDLSLRFVASPQFAAALATCPNLSSLRLRSSAIDGLIPSFLPPLLSTAVPYLTSYHGPAHFAPAFARGRRLRGARLWTSHGVSAVSAPSLLPPTLLQLGETIESLELGVTVVSDSLLNAIRDAFPLLASLSFNAHLDAFHPGTLERHTLHAPLEARVTLPRGLRPHTLRLGAQLGGNSHAELCAAARETVQGFPAAYDPTSWRRWIVDRPWYVVEWTHDGKDAGSSGSLEGALRIEYGEHYFKSFERGSRISARTVDEAILRIS